MIICEVFYYFHSAKELGTTFANSIFYRRPMVSHKENNMESSRNLKNGLALFVVFVSMLSAVGCSSRDVAVDGQTSVASGAAVKGKITLSFYEIDDDGAQGDEIESFQLDKLGAFTQTINTSADKVRVIALSDDDGNGHCSAGEAWVKKDVEIQDDKITGLALPLTVTTCE